VPGRPIPDDLARSGALVAAIRFTRGPYVMSAGQTPLAGPAYAIELERLRELRQALDGAWATLAVVLVFLVLAVILLILWWAGREQRETLWIGVLTIALMMPFSGAPVPSCCIWAVRLR
jgi:hypothetical protein